MIKTVFLYAAGVTKVLESRGIVPDAACDLDIVPNEGRNVKINYAMSNSLGFGGHNASIIFKRYEGK